MASRGQLTPAIQLLAEFHFDRQICRDELRLMAYFDYVMKNDQKLEPQRMNADDRRIFAMWKQEGFCDGGMTGLRITEEFFETMQKFLWLAYVAYEEDDE